MEYIKIAVVTDDPAYAEAVCRSLLIGNRNFDLSAHSRAEFCRRWKEAGQTFREGFDLVLWDGEGAEKICGGNLVWLTERTSQVRIPPEAETEGGFGAKDRGRYAIYKYSPSSVMIAAIFGIYGELTGRRPAGTRPDRVEVFAFASWQGGCGCTTLAMAVGQELVRFYRRRVLYLSMEGTESTAMYMDAREGMKTAGEYLYHLSAAAQAGADGAPFLEGYLIRDSYGVEAFSPAGSCNPLGIAQPAEIRRLLPALMDSGRFDAIIIDAGCGTGANVREALSFADRICLVSSREERDREARYRSFLRHGLGARSPEEAEGCSGEEAPGAGKTERASGTPDGKEPTARGPRVLPVRNRQSMPADGNAEAAAHRGEAGNGGFGGVAWISEREINGGDLLLEGRFGKDIHKLTESLYGGKM